ncbi:hypothetical protein HK101_003987 [Irineochytrium annulatum]|nr:hypothetical protein HK101_003987 [Irineochytrium annulatum]
MDNKQTQDSVDYSAVEKRDKESYTVHALEICQQMMRECDNRDPAFFQMQVKDPQFSKYGELEVVENQLRSIMKHYKNACKKKSPQSAWKPVFADLEALTIFMKSKEAWFEVKDRARAEEAFKTFGAAWIALGEHLAALGLFNENSYPSVRTAIHTAMAIGNDLNERAGKKISAWPEKLESVWTGNEFEAGDRKKNKGGDDDGKKKKKGKKGEEEEEDDTKKKPKKSAEKKEVSPWDFEAAMTALKGGRKAVGGCDFDIASFTDEKRAQVAA